MAVNKEVDVDLVRKNSTNLGPIPVEDAPPPPEVGPAPTTLIEVELIHGPVEAAPTLLQVPETEKDQRPSTSSLLDSVVEEEAEEQDGQGISTQKGPTRKTSKTTRKVIERPVGTG